MGADKGIALSVVARVASYVECCASVCNVCLWNTRSTLLHAEPANLNNSSCIDQSGMMCVTDLTVAAEEDESVLDHAGVSNSHNMINRHISPRKCDHQVLKF